MHLICPIEKACIFISIYFADGLSECTLTHTGCQQYSGFSHSLLHSILIASINLVLIGHLNLLTSLSIMICCHDATLGPKLPQPHVLTLSLSLHNFFFGAYDRCLLHMIVMITCLVAPRAHHLLFLNPYTWPKKLSVKYKTTSCM